MKKHDVKKKKLLENIKCEKSIMKGSRSNFITPLHFVFRDQQCYYIAMEWAQGGDLFSFIDKDGSKLIPFIEAGEVALRFILGCVILGLEYLHKQDIVFWDMKP
jgi:serine/threonine protein kinase